MFNFCWLGFLFSMIWWVMDCYLTEGLKFFFNSSRTVLFFKIGWVIYHFIFVYYVFLCLLLFEIIIYLIWIIRNINHRNTNIELWLILKFTPLIFYMNWKFTTFFIICKLACLHSSTDNWCKIIILIGLARRVLIAMTKNKSRFFFLKII